MKRYTIVICIVLLVASFNTSVAQQRKGLLWEISGKGMKQPAYIFGTVHLYDTTLYELPQLPAGILDRVDKVYFEMDFSKLDAAEMMAGMWIKDSTQYLDKLLDTASLGRLKKLAASSPMLKSLGDKIYAIKPTILMSILSGSHSKGTMVDFELYKIAAAKNKAVGGLETSKDQMEALNKVPVAKQVDMLKKSLQEGYSFQEEVINLTQAYVKQDIEDLMTIVNNNVPVDASFDESVRANRNITMADKIDSILHTAHPLIAIGSGHLGNSNGLLNLLQQKGYKLKNVPFVIKKAQQ